MVAMNRIMKKNLKNIQYADANILKDILSVLHEDFLEHDGCILISSSLFEKSHASVDDFQDKTGYECFVNSIHIDDYAHEDYLINSLLLVRHCFEKWNQKKRSQEIAAIISLDEFGAVVKFHTLRHNEKFLSDNLEDYDDAVLYITSSEIGLLA